MITFKNETVLEIVCSYDEKKDRIDEQTRARFAANEPVDADVFETFEVKGDKFANIQFADGSIALGVSCDDFTILND